MLALATRPIFLNHHMPHKKLLNWGIHLQIQHHMQMLITIIRLYMLLLLTLAELMKIQQVHMYLCSIMLHLNHPLHNCKVLVALMSHYQKDLKALLNNGLMLDVKPWSPWGFWLLLILGGCMIERLYRLIIHLSLVQPSF